MKRPFLLALALFASLTTLPACSDDDDNGGAISEMSLDCGIRTMPSPAVSYEISGGTLTTTVDGKSSSIQRISDGAGDKPIYGTWQLPPAPPSGDPDFIARHQLKSNPTVTFEDGRATFTMHCSSIEHAMTVSVSSAATITDTTFQILESHQEVKHWSSITGESTVSKSSVQALALELKKDGETNAQAFPFVTVSARASLR